MEANMKDYLNYEGKIAVVTGAASGMGKATAEVLKDLGAKVYAMDWNECDIEGVEYVHVDLSKKESIDEAMAKIPMHIDSFFGIAGVSGSKNDFVTTVTIDLIANKYITETYLTKRMEKGGAIAYMTSTAGNGWERPDNMDIYKEVAETEGWEEAINALNKTGFQYLPGTLGYPFAKLAMNYYTVYIQKLFGPKGIRVNAVLPGSTDTGLKDEFEKMAGGEASLLSHCGYASRLAKSSEMALPIIFLNSDMASYASGVLMEVDYGNTSEEVAGLRDPGQTISLKGIQMMMAQKA